MSITITGEERKEFDEAELLSNEFIDYLTLLNSDLGWGDHREGPLQLSSPPDRLRRVLSSLKERAEAEHRQEADLRAEVQERQERNRAMRDTCERLLAELRDEPGVLGRRGRSL